MAEKATVRLLLAIAAAKQWSVEHFDITAAYLHEQYSHDQPVYVRQHPRFDGSYKHNCKAGILRGNLYGTPPASNIYFSALTKHLLWANYRQYQADPCLFYKTITSTGDIIVVSVSIDDFLTTSPNKLLIDELYQHLSTKYNIKRIGTPSIFLNWRVQTTPAGDIHISQPHTIATILDKTNMTNCNPKHTPLPEKIDQNASNSVTTPSYDAAEAYRRTIGDLRYIADSTRPDIYHAVNRLAANMHNPTHTHWQHLKWTVRYLKHTKNHGILFRARPHSASTDKLLPFADADYANAPDRKSYTGVVHTYYHAPISWTSNKQSVVALSTCETEYLAASMAVQQTNWLRRLLTEINQTPTDATPLFIYSNSAIQVAKNTAPTKRRKLIDIRHHCLHDNINRQAIKVHHIPSASNPADLFTKPLGRQRHHELTKQISITPQLNKTPDPVVGTGD